MSETETSLLAIRAIRVFVDALPGMWRPDREQEWIMRWYAFDEDGRVSRIDTSEARMMGELVGASGETIKDLVAGTVEVYVKVYRPAALLMASEGWATIVRHDLAAGPPPSFKEMDEDYKRPNFAERHHTKKVESLLAMVETSDGSQMFYWPIVGRKLMPREGGPMNGASHGRFCNLLGKFKEKREASHG